MSILAVISLVFGGFTVGYLFCFLMAAREINNMLTIYEERIKTLEMITRSMKGKY